VLERIVGMIGAHSVEHKGEIAPPEVDEAGEAQPRVFASQSGLGERDDLAEALLEQPIASSAEPRADIANQLGGDSSPETELRIASVTFARRP
jgi:hypothetical protein